MKKQVKINDNMTGYLNQTKYIRTVKIFPTGKCRTGKSNQYINIELNIVDRLIKSMYKDRIK